MPEEPANPQGFFGRYAPAYTTSVSHAKGDDLRMLLEALSLKPGERALDVATGTGHTAFALSERVDRVVGLDLTGEMIDEARRLGDRKETRPVSFVSGDAENLPFDVGTFDVVTCRRASHHFRHIDRFLSEVRRVLVPGGRLGIADMCPAEGGEELLNRMERVRDPSHARALSATEWNVFLEKAGLHGTSVQFEVEPYTLEQWLSPVGLGGPEESRARSLLQGARESERTALGVRRGKGGEVQGFDKRRIVTVAVA